MEDSAIFIIDTDLAEEMKLPGARRPLVIEWTDEVTFHTMDIHLPTQSITQSELVQAGIQALQVQPLRNATPEILFGLDNSPLTAPRNTWKYDKLVVSETLLVFTQGVTPHARQQTIREKAIPRLRSKDE